MYVGYTEPLRAPLHIEETDSKVYHHLKHNYRLIGYTANPYKTDERIKQIFLCFLLTLAVMCTLGCSVLLRQRFNKTATNAWHNRKLMPVYRMCPPTTTPYKEIPLNSFPILTSFDFPSTSQQQQDKNAISEACQRVQKTLLEQDEKTYKEMFELTWGQIQGYSTQHHSTLLIEMLVDYFQQLATEPFSKIKSGYDTLPYCIEKVIKKRHFLDPKHQEQSHHLMRAFLLEIPSPIRERIADNIGQSFFCEYMAIYDETFPPIQDFCKFLQTITSHNSPTQLMLSILTDNVERLQSCLDNGLNPFMRLRAITLSESSFPLLELAISLNSHRSVDLLLRRFYFSFDDNVLWGIRLTPDIFKVLWSKDIPLRDNLSSQNILANLFSCSNYDAFLSVLRTYPNFLLLRTRSHPSLIEEIYAEASKTPSEELRYFEAAFTTYTTTLNKSLSVAILTDMRERILLGETRWLPFLSAEERSTVEKILKDKGSVPS